MAEQERLAAPVERRRQQREVMLGAIRAAAGAVLEEDGIAGLNMHKVAQRVNMRVQSLYNYVSSRAALYDAVVQDGAMLLLEHDRHIWKTTPPTWERIETWLQARVRFAREHRALYELITGGPVREFMPSDDTVRLTLLIGETAVLAVQELVDAGVASPPVSSRRAINLLLAASHGIVAETLGKEHLPDDPDRFTILITDFTDTFRLAWSAERSAS